MDSEAITARDRDRIRASSSREVNERIDRETRERISGAVRERSIDERLEELDGEWDIERYLATNAASVVLLGLTLGTFHKRRWLLLPAVAMGFLLQHAIEGWCPPLTLFRRRGVRSRKEIDREKFALKALRGDFAAAADAESAMDAVTE